MEIRHGWVSFDKYWNLSSAGIFWITGHWVRHNVILRLFLDQALALIWEFERKRVKDGGDEVAETPGATDTKRRPNHEIRANGSFETTRFCIFVSIEPVPIKSGFSHDFLKSSPLHFDVEQKGIDKSERPELITKASGGESSIMIIMLLIACDPDRRLGPPDIFATSTWKPRRYKALR